MPALVRAGLPLQAPSIRIKHDGASTLVVSYEKPPAVIDHERKERAKARESSSLSSSPSLSHSKGNGSLLAPKNGVGPQQRRGDSQGNGGGREQQGSECTQS